MIIIGTEKEIKAMIEEACPYCVSIIKCDGDTITTDVGYADEGIEFFVKHLKQRLRGK